MFAGSPLPCLRSQMRVAVTSWIFSDGRSLLKCNNCQRYLNLNELLRLCWGNNVMMENRKGGWGCTFGPMMIVDGWWQSPARATPVNIGHMAPDACVGVGSGQWILIEVCGKKLFDLCVDAWITRRPSLWMLSCDANAMESGVFTVKSVRIFSDLNMNISLLNDPHNEIRLYNLLNYMWNLVLAWYIT